MRKSREEAGGDAESACPTLQLTSSANMAR